MRPQYAIPALKVRCTYIGIPQQGKFFAVGDRRKDWSSWPLLMEFYQYVFRTTECGKPISNNCNTHRRMVGEEGGQGLDFVSCPSFRLAVFLGILIGALLPTRRLSSANTTIVRRNIPLFTGIASAAAVVPLFMISV